MLGIVTVGEVELGLNDYLAFLALFILAVGFVAVAIFLLPAGAVVQTDWRPDDIVLVP